MRYIFLKGDIMKIKYFLIICSAIFLFQSSSPWEGAASVAPAGELPSSGFFVNTNAFPRNTVVDITNIENGKSTRVIVANTLNSPGLLAIVSREAAELIGMRNGSISRIRMVAPSDPIAYQRFTESMTQDIPSFDSGNVIRNEEALLTEVYNEDTYKPPITQSFSSIDIINRDEPSSSQIPMIAPVVNEFSGPSYLMEPEWGGPGRLEIVDVPRFIEEPFVTETPIVVEELVTEPDPVIEEPVIEEPVYLVEAPIIEEPVIEETVYIAEEPVITTEEIIKDVSVFLTEKPMEDIEKDVGTFIAEGRRDEIIKDLPEFNPERERIEVVKELLEFNPEREHIEVVKEVSEWEKIENPELKIVKADVKAPEQELYGIDPNDIIPGIVTAPVEQKEAEPIRVIPSAPVSTFSVRTIPRLDRGQYYVQLAALPEENVEKVIRQFDPQFFRYDPVIYKDGDNLYRILIGPLNQGESAAVLARFKSIGYRDAFVRRGG